VIGMGRALYGAPVGAAVALVAATPKTVLAVIAPAQFGIDARKLRVGFDGITATDKAVLVELVAYTADGTGTPGTIAQVSGRSITAGFTSKYNYSIEPTGATVYDRWTLTPIGGTAIIDLGDEYDVAASGLLGVRCTAPTSAVNVNATLFVARC
jgi:hypothetical protein